MSGKKMTALAGALAGVAALMVPALAQAAFKLELSDGVTTVSITDNGVGDLNNLPGQILFAGTVGGFTTNLTGALSNNPGTADGASLQLQSIDIRNGGPSGTLTLRLTDTGFLLPVGDRQLDSALALTFTKSAAGDSASFQSFADTSNVEFGTGTSAVSLAFTSPGSVAPVSASGSTNLALGGASAYSLTNQAVIKLTSGAQVNLSGTTTVTASDSVPEPATLSLLGLSGLLMFRRRTA
jgi:hypothetical protein